MPVVEILEKGYYNGQRAMTMTKYAQGSKDIVKTVKGEARIVGESTLLNEKSIIDLTNIKSKMQSNKIKIDDLQFLIGSDGKIVIADPLQVYIGQVPSKNNLRTIDKLIEVARRNLR